jgi:hypothetical protein
MKAIRTRYVGPTNTRGSRIIASDGDKNSISTSYPHGLNSDEGHELAAYLLMQKMGWGNHLVGGGFQHDMYWTMIPIDTRGDKPAYAYFLTQPKIQREYAA